MAIAGIDVSVDHVTASVIQGALENIAVEMGYKLSGLAGQPAELRLERADGSVVQLPSKVPHTQVTTGDRFVCIGPAGGGYGHPYDREPERVLGDVLDGLISVATARRDFGVVLTPALTIDRDATAAARGAHPVLPGA